MSNHTDPKQREDIPWRRIAFIAVAVYAVLFLLLNDDRVGVSFVLFTAHTSLIFLILISMGLGAALALFGPALWQRRKRRGAEVAGEQPGADDSTEKLIPPADAEAAGEQPGADDSTEKLTPPAD